jgi:hypothetical protein
MANLYNSWWGLSAYVIAALKISMAARVQIKSSAAKAGKDGFVIGVKWW